MLNFFKKPLVIIVLLAAIFVAGFYFYKSTTKAPQYEIFAVSRGDITQEVSVTGQVKSAEDIKLAFEKSGKIVQINAKVGSKIKTGQILVSLDNAELRAQLAQANAGTQTQQAKLDELKKGTRTEEIQVAEATYNNAQKSLVDAEKNLENIKNKAGADLKEGYDAAITAANDSITTATYSLYVLTDIQYAYFQSLYDTDSIQVTEAKADAIYSLLGTSGAGRATNNAIGMMAGGTKVIVQSALVNPTYANIDLALIQTKNSLLKVKSALDSVPTSKLSSTDKTNLSAEKSNINTAITTISGKVEAIAVQKATNQNNISTAEASITSAKNTLASAEANMALKKAGSTPEQISAQEAQVKQAEANALSIAAQLSKTYIKSPFDGIVTQQDAKIGEMATANQTLVSIISNAKFEIEANVSETEIAKIKLQDKIKITLDALGPKEEFSGSVIEIDPAETVVSGVVYYKVTSIFDSENPQIKPGMTANLDIKTDERMNVLAIPYYLIQQKNGDKYVKVMEKSGEVKDRLVKIGLEGETMVEILEGLKENEQVVIEK